MFEAISFDRRAISSDCSATSSDCGAISSNCSLVPRFSPLPPAEAGRRHEPEARPRDFRGIVGRSPALLAVLRDVRLVAVTDTTVLVTGESGTGKELIARAIHESSGRRERPMVRVNCAAMPASLMESELFGHERGAFTGATARREGRFALADGGSIFLDEIGELPLELQAKLLRVLQEGEFEPVGTSRTRKVDVRVIAATNRDLEDEVRAGRFREDLYYRLNVFPVRVPALRERLDDIPPLVEAFLERLAKRLGRSFDAPDGEALRCLRAHTWPGNVRELQNVAERAAISAGGGRLDFARALPALRADQPAGVAEGARGRVLTMRELQQIERNNLMLALELTGWRVSGDAGAAQLLGINASTLASRIKALGLQRQRLRPEESQRLRPEESQRLRPEESQRARPDAQR
ncbi:MAG TPA: sigma 54-interacting transcriptional regulator, partial [Burkholderiales bacterium]|nr:sigma 54-interacting transcriptional regulator [Burkholderiales bacterium]